MNNYEILNEQCKILWQEGLDFTNKKYSQVSGYIFNDRNELLIVRNNNTWTIPGGHPEKGEEAVQTLIRETLEEACIEINDIKYLGAVEVVESGDTYYQLRYRANVLKVLPFSDEFEISERKFVNIKDLNKYITWSSGITFSQQIESALKLL